MFQDKRSAAALSVASNSTLVLMKLVVGITIGSISIISEAVHSATDLVAALIAFYSVRFAYEPADAKHPFGHGKMENLSGLIEAGLIILGAFYIIHESVDRLLAGTHIISVDLGIGVMLISLVANSLISRHLLRVARAEESLALEADAWHLIGDVITSLGVVLGLIAVRITGSYVLDPLIAIGVALVIIKTAYDLGRKAIPGLIDTRLPEEEEEKIRSILFEHYGQHLGFHELRSRKAGAERHVDLHLVVSKGLSVEEAHHLCDHLEEDIRAHLPNARISIHVEPPVS